MCFEEEKMRVCRRVEHSGGPPFAVAEGDDSKGRSDLHKSTCSDLIWMRPQSHERKIEMRTHSLRSTLHCIPQSSWGSEARRWTAGGLRLSSAHIRDNHTCHGDAAPTHIHFYTDLARIPLECVQMESLRRINSIAPYHTSAPGQ